MRSASKNSHITILYRVTKTKQTEMDTFLTLKTINSTRGTLATY